MTPDRSLTKTQQSSHVDQKKAATMSRHDRVALLERPASELPLATQAMLLGLNRTHLYYVPMPPSPEELLLKRQIDELFTARPFYGVRKITAQLRKDGCLVNHKAVARHMREMGLAAICPGRNLSKRTHAHAVYPIRIKLRAANGNGPPDPLGGRVLEGAARRACSVL